MVQRRKLVRRIFPPTLLLSSLAILSAACWGLGTVLSRAVVAELPPLTLLVVQLSASVGFLAVVLAVQGRLNALILRDWRAGLPGLLEPGLAYGFGVVGLAFTTASRATVLGAIEPLFVAVLAWLFLHEKLGWRIGVLLGLAVLGVGLVSMQAITAAAGTLGGDVLILLGTASAAVYVVVTRWLLAEREPLPLTFLQQLVGLLGVGLVWLVTSFLGASAAALPQVAVGTLLLAMLSGVVQYGLAFWLYLLALRGLAATVAACYLTLIPFFGVAGAAVLLSERLTALQWLGAACIVGPVLLLAWQGLHGQQKMVGQR